MIRILHEKVKTARKQYICAACEWIHNYGRLSELMDDYKMPFSDKRKLVIMKNERYSIFPDTKYLEQVSVGDDGFSCIQCRLDAVEICEKYRLNYED